MHRFILTTCLVLVVAACAGDPSGAPDGAAPLNDIAGGGDGATGPSDANVATTTMTSATESEGDSESPTGSNGTVTIGDTTYLFIVEEGGTCDPDFFGTFRATMTRVDESGRPMGYEENPGFKQILSLSFNAQAEGLIGGELDGVLWTAGADDYEASSIDSVDIDGNRAIGTVTFVSPDGGGNPVEGSFDVTCVGG